MNLLRTAGYGDVKTEAGAVLGDGNTYTAISGKTAEGTGREYYIRISGDYLILLLQITQMDIKRLPLR